MKIKIDPAFERMSIHLEAELLDGSKLTIIIGDDADLEQIKLHAKRILNAFGVDVVEIYDEDYLLGRIEKEGE